MIAGRVLDLLRTGWRRRHGGTLFALWPYAASALVSLRKRLPRVPEYYEHARAIAEALRSVYQAEGLLRELTGGQ